MTDTEDTELQKMTPVLDDHAEWYGQILRRLFYPDQHRNEEMLQSPDSFKNWISRFEKEDLFEKPVLAGLKRVHDELHATAERLGKKAAPGVLPDFRSFDILEDLYEGFIRQLRRLQHDAAQADGGLDPVSGLRNKKVMAQELERELERRARRGRPFCLALARIDNFERIPQFCDEAQQKKIIATLGRLIRQCMRSFDDAYRCGDAEFVMSLKHSDTGGGTAASNRLRSFVEREGITVPDGKGGTVPMTLSYCVAEPVPGDTLDDLMNNMRADLERYRDETGNTALQYFEQSPLSRLVKSIDT